MLRILVTGSRTWDDAEIIEGALRPFVEQVGAENVTVVHGACPHGADALAHRIARRLGMAPEPHPADWRRHGKRAGFLRNKAMVALGADACLAFIRDGSRGATHTADLAEAANIPTIRIEYAGVTA